MMAGQIYVQPPNVDGLCPPGTIPQPRDVYGGYFCDPAGPQCGGPGEPACGAPNPRPSPPPPPTQSDWFTYIAQKLCNIERALNTIAGILQHCCDQGSNVPCSNQNSQTNTQRPSVTNAATRVLGNNPRRMAFTVNNESATVAVYLGTDSSIGSSGSGAIIAVQPGQIYYATAAQFPSSLTREWYAIVPAGSVTATIAEESSN